MPSGGPYKVYLSIYGEFMHAPAQPGKGFPLFGIAARASPALGKGKGGRLFPGMICG